MKKWKSALAAGLAAMLLGTGFLLAGCSSSEDTDSALSDSDSDQESWIGDQAAVELVEGLSQEETGLSLPTENYLFEVDDEVGDIGDVTCYLVHAYLVEDGTGTRYLAGTLYVAVDGSQVYTYDLDNDTFLTLWDTEEEESAEDASEDTAEEEEGAEDTSEEAA